MSVCLLLPSFIYCLSEVTFFYLIYLSYFLPTRGGQQGGASMGVGTGGGGASMGGGGTGGGGKHGRGRTNGCIMHQVHTRKNLMSPSLVLTLMTFKQHALAQCKLKSMHMHMNFLKVGRCDGEKLHAMASLLTNSSDRGERAQC
jgi:hypothetical protein